MQIASPKLTLNIEYYYSVPEYASGVEYSFQLQPFFSKFYQKRENIMQFT